MHAPVGSRVTGERLRSTPLRRAWSAVAAGLFAASVLVGFGTTPSRAADPVYTRPLDIIFIVDRSGSMDQVTPDPAGPIVPGVNNTRLGWANDAANDLVASLEANGGVGGPTGLHHVGLVTYGGGSSTINLALGAATGPEVHGAIDVWDGYAGNGATPIDSGMSSAVAAMTAGRRTDVDGVAVLQVFIMLSDGRPNPDPGARPTPEEIAAYLGTVDQAFSIGIGPTGTGDPNLEPDLALMQLLANPATGYKHLVDAASLPPLFGEMAQQLLVGDVEIQAAATPTGPVEVGTDVTYTVDVWNDAEDTPLTAVGVTVDGCATIAGPTGDNGDGFLAMGETWSYSCTKTLAASTDTEACANAQYIGGGTDSACLTVSVATAVAPTPSPTPAPPAPASPAPTPPPPPPAPVAPPASAAPTPSEQPAELTSPSSTPEPVVAVLPPPPAAPPARPSDGGTDSMAKPAQPNVVDGVLAVALEQVNAVVKPEAAVAVATAFSFPLALMAAVVAFLVGQGRVDARDPKLRSAPRTPQETVLSFRNEEEL